MKSIIPVLLCGGGGTRLWPLSTEDKPKQFQDLFGDGTLFQETLRRAKAAGAERAVVVGAARHRDAILHDILVLGSDAPACELLLEPSRRDSAAAIAAGAAFVAERYGAERVVAVLPCDHRIPDAKAFGEALRRAAEIAEAGRLCTFGIMPTHPATGYGYIMRSDLAVGAGGYAAAAFVEKPDMARARSYLASGRHYWNGGMFIFRADAFAAEGDLHMPEVMRAARAAVRNGVESAAGVWSLDPEAFEQAPRISIDYALFEKSERVAVLPTTFAWSDVGAWDAVYDETPADADGLVTRGDVVSAEVSNSLIIGAGIRVAALGVSGLVVVATPEGVLVTTRSQAGDIKRVVT